MNRTLGERHLLLANNSRSARLSTAACEAGIFADIQGGRYVSADFMDFTQAISGDDLARIAAFEPKREPSLWADVTTHAPAVAA